MKRTRPILDALRQGPRTIRDLSLALDTNQTDLNRDLLYLLKRNKIEREELPDWRTPPGAKSCRWLWRLKPPVNRSLATPS